MFKAVLANTSLFKDSVETIAELIDEAHFTIDKDGISLIATDRAMVAVVEFRLRSDAFEKYHIDSPAKIGLNMLNLVSIVKRMKPDDKLTLELDDKVNKLNMVLKGSSTRRFSVPIIDISEEEVPPINELAFPLIIDVASELVKEGINDAEVVADSVIFKGDQDFFGMLAEGDMSTTELKLDKAETASMSIQGKGFVRSRFPIDYLKRMIRAGKLAQTLTIKLGNDYPMRMEFKNDQMSLNFVLAPRVEE